MTDRLLTPAEVAVRLGVGQKTLANWRYQRVGPQFVRAGRRLLGYEPDAIDRWIAQQTVKTTP